MHIYIYLYTLSLYSAINNSIIPISEKRIAKLMYNANSSNSGLYMYISFQLVA